MTDRRTGERAGKGATINGAALGIGAATVMGLAEPGAKVLLGGKNVEGAQDLAQRARAEGCGARAVATQVGRGGDNRRLVETKLGELGGPQVYRATKGLLVAFVRAIPLARAPYGLGACAGSPVATDDAAAIPRPCGPGGGDGEVSRVLRKTAPRGRLARPGDIADDHAFHASEGAAMITGTGTMLDIDGGRNI